jgi:hypothetical protein
MRFKLLLFFVCLLLLAIVACKPKPVGKTTVNVVPAGGNPKLIGEWRAIKDSSKLKITDKTFALESDSPDPEDYFVKGDTIYTSFQGNLPYTKYAIKKLDDHRLVLFTPDSVMISYTK